jgi:hypothetical protein
MAARVSVTHDRPKLRVATAGMLAMLAGACGGDGRGRDCGTFSVPPIDGDSAADTSSGGEASSEGDHVTSGGEPEPDLGTTSGTSRGDTSGSPPDPPPTTSTLPDPTTGGVEPGGCPPTGPLDCSPGPGSGRPDTCVDGRSCFIDLVQSSVMGVISDYPAWFDFSDGNPYVLQVEDYMNAVVASVNAAGECSIRDPNAGDEIVVKHDNDFAENFDILSAEGYARYGELIYTSTCSPAWF